MTIAAKYEDGVFKPLEDVRIEDGALLEVLVPEQKPAGQRRSVAELPFFGMWKDREDIGDGIEYVDKLRNSPRG